MRDERVGEERREGRPAKNISEEIFICRRFSGRTCQIIILC